MVRSALTQIAERSVPLAGDSFEEVLRLPGFVFFKGLKVFFFFLISFPWFCFPVFFLGLT